MIRLNSIQLKYNYNCLKTKLILIHRDIHIANSIHALKTYRHSPDIINKSIGFVPTMGSLHQGHIELMKTAKLENNIVITSIFVNPTQFSQGEDFDKYPRNLQKDLDIMKSSKAVDCLFAPSTDEMYPLNALCHVEPSAFSNILEGKARPEFFRGVATIVAKLFNIVECSTAYFGQKDISQCILIQKMVNDLNFNTKIKVIETIREADGLAMSSRNAYLTSQERAKAAILYKALSQGKEFCEKQESVSRDVIIDEINKVLLTEELVTRIEYVSIASHIDMTELNVVNREKGAVISAAIRIGNVRLIDNILVGDANRILSDS